MDKVGNWYGDVKQLIDCDWVCAKFKGAARGVSMREPNARGLNGAELMTGIVEDDIADGGCMFSIFT